MALQFLFNDAWQDCAQLLVTDGSDAATTDYEAIENITRGPRHLEWTQSGTAVRRVVYLNKAGNLGANACVIARADRMTSGYTIRRYATYSASPTTIETSGSAPTCIGLNSDDYVLTFSATTSQQALSLEFAGSSAKTFNKVYFGTTLDFDYPNGPTIEPFWNVITVDRHVYHVRERGTFTLTNVSNTLVSTLQAKQKRHEQPCFIYDSLGTLLADKLWHCIIGNISVLSTFNDINTVQIEAFRLREYPSVA